MNGTTERNECMTLPADFQFSQASLQDYVDCPRRFQLRYVLRVAWPAPEAEPVLENERYLQQGAAFHRLVHQHALGL
ncbi:MAG: PD-(D/E)XK nuclease family protein, partial [Chloroflexi bacterium]|nr:PD-(D/E)XK nuclease family protein [Chloroflexota bacterium]